MCVGSARADDLHACLDGMLAGDDPDVGLSGAGLGAEITELVRARHRLDALIERRLGVVDARGLAECDGVASTAAWLRGKCRIAGAEASGRVKTARMLRELPATAKALADGAITLDHARAIASLAKDTDLAATRQVEAGLVDVARIIDPVRLSAELATIRDAYKKDGTGEPDTSDHEKRRLSVAASMSGMFSVGGWLTADGGALVKAGLDALSKPKPGDTRTPAQRRADALVELVRLGLAAAGVPDSHGVRPTLIVNTRLEPDPAARPADRWGGLRFGPGFVPGGGIIPSETVERFACDATIRRVALRRQRRGARPRPGDPHRHPRAMDGSRRPRRRLRDPRP
jgi:uncharacterized protein DUF222